MTHLHLQLVGRRFNELADNYLRRISWNSEATANALVLLQRTLQTVCSKEQFYSSRSLIFNALQYEKDVLLLLKPITCCGKCLLYASSLIQHLLSDNHSDGVLHDESKRLIILFNLYVQVTNEILVRYDKNYESIDQAAVENLRKAQDFISCILRKPITREPAVAGLFVGTRFKKWKVVFDYTCHPCQSQGVVRCRILGAIAWYNVHADYLVSNPILHVGSKLHIESLRMLPSDRIIASRLTDANNNQWSNAALYLLNLRQVDLDKKCSLAEQVTKSTRFSEVESYLTEQFAASIGRINVYFFGSRVQGVAQVDADLDVCIKSCAGQEDKITYNKAVNWAKAHSSEVQIERQIPQQPLLLRVHVNALDQTLDLTFGGGYVVANAKLISYYFNMQPLARKMYFCLKEWKALTDITSQFHTHAVTMLIIFFMQQKHYLPVVEKVVIGPIDQMFDVKFRPSENFLLDTPRSLLNLIKDFFAYWNQFDWIRNGICVLNGTVQAKESFRFATDRISEAPMMSTDYFDQTRNTCSNIKVGDFQTFRFACNEAVDVLKHKNSI
ncbi:terminal uridylyltransferase Tailor-like [Wyeomyia smithii]|uniref:terminal uridylyltransferase Tailor-like n=1 Tax=Wyeomyia smithii TaxID=174621 RepID=UPI002467F0F4|nr:terminal uridylyltransferase Tailor-like [Wyeomyia smithii]